MFTDKAFELKTRRDIYKYLMENPGIHLSKISKDLKIPQSTLKYHLKYLVKKDFIKQKTEKIFTRYYVNKKVSDTDKKILKILRRRVPRSIIVYLLLYSNTSLIDMVKFGRKWKNHPSGVGADLNKHHSTLFYHINNLIEQGIVESYRYKSTIRYQIKNPDDIILIFLTYKDSILADTLENFFYWITNDHNNQIKRTENKIFDIFPHPYHP